MIKKNSLQAITTTPNKRYDIGRMQTVSTFSSYEQEHRAQYGAENLGFLANRAKKTQVYQRFDFDTMYPACNFIKNETLALVFSCEF